MQELLSNNETCVFFRTVSELKSELPFKEPLDKGKELQNVKPVICVLSVFRI